MRISDWSSDVCSSDLVYLRGGFHALDTVNLVGATIGGDLDCDAATFEHAGGLALACSRAKVEGMFRHGSTKIVQEVNLNGMRVRAVRDAEGRCGPEEHPAEVESLMHRSGRGFCFDKK